MRLDILRNGDIQLLGSAPKPEVLKLVTTIPLRTERGRLTWEKELLWETWKEHKKFDAKFSIIIETIITADENGIFDAQSKGSYKWTKKPFIVIDFKLGKIKYGLDEVAGKEIDKAIKQYIKEIDKEIEKFLNQ